MGSVKEDLLRPDAYAESAAHDGRGPNGSGRAADVELVETHISWVFLTGSHVYKVKKPVDLGFLDFRSVDQRRAACEAEVRLNARLAPDVYLGVVPVRRTAAGVHSVGGDPNEGDIVDWAVRMVRLADADRADNLLAAGRLRGEDIDGIAEHLARFHAAARSDGEVARFGTVSAIEQSVRENFVQTRGDVLDHVRPAEADEIERRQLGFLRDCAPLFDSRIRSGRVRDAHGDLRLEHVYLDGQRTTVIDCIEFSDRFRFVDVCADIAFLSMDLAWHGRVDLAERLLAKYARSANDYDLYALVDFYEGYRAYVRAKVSMLLAADESANEALRRGASRDARRYLLLALSAGRSALVAPALVCVGGLIASGKSTIAENLADDLGAPIVDADRTRKHMLGVAPAFHVDAAAWNGAYDPKFTELVYAEVLRRAGVVLSSGRPVLVDASFRSRSMRDQARRLAASHRVPFWFVECRADPSVCKARLVHRERESGVSDARIALFDEFRTHFEAPEELAEGERFVLDTAQPLEASLAVVRAKLQTWPPGLVA
jgi:aminoglycoside phosphotransferase family enzyme/predicted kinase